MTYVSEIAEEQASPELKLLYQQARERFGFLPNYFRAQGRLPKAIAGQLSLAEAILADGALSPTQKEQIGIVVSGINTSSYCVAIHLELLRAMGIEKSLGRKLATDYPHAAVDEKLKVLFRFADKLTRMPAEIDETDVGEVRKAGWDDAALQETVLIVAWFNFINRVSMGLGLVADF